MNPGHLGETKLKTLGNTIEYPKNERKLIQKTLDLEHPTTDQKTLLQLNLFKSVNEAKLPALPGLQLVVLLRLRLSLFTPSFADLQENRQGILANDALVANQEKNPEN